MMNFLRSAVLGNIPREARRTELLETAQLPDSHLPEVDRTVQVLSDLARGDAKSFSFLLETLHSSPAVRTAVLEAVCEHPSLIETPKRRTKLLEAAEKFPGEPLALQLAITTLESTYLKNAPDAVTAAGRIIKSALTSQDLAHHPSAALEDRLLKVAKRYQPGGGDLAAGAALHILPLTALVYERPERILREARAWFAARHQEKNPWFAVLSQAPSREQVSFLAQVLEGRVPERDVASFVTSLMRFPFTLHEIAIMSTVLTVVTRQVCDYLKIPKVISNATVAAFSVCLVVGSKTVSDAYKADSLNAKRHWERVEAIARLASLRAALDGDTEPHNAALANRIGLMLRKASLSLMQSPVVRQAARVALEGGAFDPTELWNYTLSVGEFSEAARMPHPDIRA